MKTQEIKIARDIQETIARQHNKSSLVDIEAKEVGIELLKKVAEEYNERHGYVPHKWQQAIDKALFGETLDKAA